jgi:transposase-like protein
MSDTQDNQEHDTTIFSNDQKLKLTQLINEGMQVMNEVETLNSGLSDTIKEVAEEMNIKSTVLKKAIRTAHKMEFGKTQKEQELLENILVTVGKTL